MWMGEFMRIPVLRGAVVASSLCIVAVVASGCGRSGSGAQSHTSASASPSMVSSSDSAAAVSSPSDSGLSSADQQFVSDMQSTINFDAGVQDSQIADFGEEVCADRQSGQSVAAEVSVAQKSWTGIKDGDGLQMVLLAEKDICPGQQAAQTITYVVSGTSGADVTYGPSGSDYQGSVPMSVTKSLGNPSYYAINAQLQGYGSVTCKLEVDGVVISKASASGSYNIADCEIDQDITSGSWQDTNAG